MTQLITLSLPGVPQTKLRPRFSRFKGKVRTYDAQKEENDTMKWQFRSRMDGPPLSGPLSVDVKFFMPIPKSTTKKKRALILAGEIKHTKKPDCDNLIKKPLDCMNGIVYIDDSQIYEIYATKLYSETPRTEIIIKWLA